MNAIRGIFAVFTVLLLFAQAQASDLDVVQSILDENGLDWNVNELVTLKEGRIVALNLNNKDFGKVGIKYLSPQIGLLNELEVLTLNDNDLIILPEELYNCRKLSILEIKNNDLIILPYGIYNLSRLKELDLRNNELRSLPIDIVKLRNLWKMQLWGNELVSLPSKIGYMGSLKELYLRGNRLERLPRSITRLRLTYLDMLENKLCNVQPSVDKWLSRYDRNYEMVQYCEARNYRFQLRSQ